MVHEAVSRAAKETWSMISTRSLKRAARSSGALADR